MLLPDDLIADSGGRPLVPRLNTPCSRTVRRSWTTRLRTVPYAGRGYIQACSKNYSRPSRCGSPRINERNIENVP
ncbi:hypothetical protein KM043_015294 [Ampulex compressa]|nr:hypothetical protein KM043_015294 [Ampulex compressa]